MQMLLEEALVAQLCRHDGLGRRRGSRVKLRAVCSAEREGSLDEYYIKGLALLINASVPFRIVGRSYCERGELRIEGSITWLRSGKHQWVG